MNSAPLIPASNADRIIAGLREVLRHVQGDEAAAVVVYPRTTLTRRR